MRGSRLSPNSPTRTELEWVVGGDEKGISGVWRGRSPKFAFAVPHSRSPGRGADSVLVRGGEKHHQQEIGGGGVAEAEYLQETFLRRREKGS